MGMITRNRNGGSGQRVDDNIQFEQLKKPGTVKAGLSRHYTKSDKRKYDVLNMQKVAHELSGKGERTKNNIDLKNKRSEILNDVELAALQKLLTDNKYEHKRAGDLCDFVKKAFQRDRDSFQVVEINKKKHLGFYPPNEGFVEVTATIRGETNYISPDSCVLSNAVLEGGAILRDGSIVMSGSIVEQSVFEASTIRKKSIVAHSTVINSYICESVISNINANKAKIGNTLGLKDKHLRDVILIEGRQSTEMEWKKRYGKN